MRYAPEVRPINTAARVLAGFFIPALIPALALALLALGGCASMVPQTIALRTEWPVGLPLKSEIADVAFFPQQALQCGPAALATAMVKAGVATTPEALAPEVFLPAREGSLQIDMLATPRRLGRVSYQLAAGDRAFIQLLMEVAAGNPVIVLQDLGALGRPRWHYAVVVGYDYPAGMLYLRSGESERLTLPFTVLEYTWRKSAYWAMVVMPPTRTPATADDASYVGAIHAMARAAPRYPAPENGMVKVAYQAALERWPQSLAAAIGLANVYYDQGKLADAEGVLREALARQPDAVVALNNLAQTVSDLGRQDEAWRLIDRATLLAARNGTFVEAVKQTRILIERRMVTN